MSSYLQTRLTCIATLVLACCLFGLTPAGALAQQDGSLAPTSQPDQSSLDDDYLWDDEAEPSVADPIEPVNRAMFWFNDKLYFYLLKPIARTYRVVPEPARVSVSRAFSNLGTPVRFLNASLQFKFKQAGTELGRFVINSTVGVLGLYDPAATIGWRQHDEDFGQTLGHYGTGTGFYLVLPVFGPSNLRDGVARIVDNLTAPIPSPYYLKLKQIEEIGLSVYDQVNRLSLDKDTYEGIKRDALDPYLFVRNAYMQRRAAKVEE